MKRKKKSAPVGRPSKYDPIFCRKIVEYFDIEPINYKDITVRHKDGTEIEKSEEEAAPIPWFSGFCKSIGIDNDTMSEWVKIHPEFSDAYKEAKRFQLEFIMTNAMRGNFSAAFAIFSLKNIARWQDSTDRNWSDAHEITGTDGAPIDINIRRAEIIQGVQEVVAYKEPSRESA